MSQLLSGRGHRATQPTLTGLGERAHLLSPEVGMEVFAQDIINHIQVSDLRDVVLVGHSFGGNVATLVADRIGERIRRVIYLDGDIARDGCSTFDLMPGEIVAERLAAQIAWCGVACMPVPSLAQLGLRAPANASWIEARLTPHPIRSYQDSIRLQRAPGAGLPGDFVLCTDPDYGMMEGSLTFARQLGFTLHELATGHDAMLADPRATADLLDRIVRAG